MKIICDCGNESIFNTINEDTEEENTFYEDEGQYATMKPDTFGFWQQHDQVGIFCEKCNKAVWLFT